MHSLQIAPFLGLWDETDGGAPVLINLSENHTFRIDGAFGQRHILRVHRPGYQSADSINSELDWLVALRSDTGLPISQPLAGRDGKLLQVLPLAEGARHAVLFTFERGHEPHPDHDLSSLFETLGRFAATAHQHSRTYATERLQRQKWSAAAVLDSDGLWGDWRHAPGVTAEIAGTLNQLDHRLRRDLEHYGEGSDRFGLIHADMRLGNLLIDGDTITLIDFDDCGFCWFMYDYAAAISFHEDHEDAPAWRQSWLKGYQSVRKLAAVDIAALDTMVMLRRMALLAWIGSHGETALAKQHADNFAAVTAKLALAYLR